MELDGLLPQATNQCPVHNEAYHKTSKRSTASDGFDERQAAESKKTARAASPSTGVLLVNHGSHSSTWRRMLLDVHAEVRDELLAMPSVQSVRTGFMEYTEPSIASQLKSFDDDGVERILIVPLLLTISSHSFDDIPNICGLRNDPDVIDNLTKEKIERYTPLAQVEIAPLLDYPKLVRKNLVRRISDLRAADLTVTGQLPSDGCVLVGYGSAEFDNEWIAFFEELAEFAVDRLRVSATAWSWCGHIAQYRSEPTTTAIRKVLQAVDRALVVPILVAYDEMFQARIIGRAIREVGDPERILYNADAILPEPEVGRWIVSIVNQMVVNRVTIRG